MNNPCDTCLLKESIHSPMMDGYGPMNARIVLIGEAPGEEEDAMGRPWVGTAGRLLRRVWKEILGFELDEIFLTNTVRCKPPNNRTPRLAECRRCWPHVEAELADVKPELVIVAGNPAMHTIGIKGKITVNGGKVYPSKSPNYKAIIPIIHPSAVCRNSRNMVHLRSGLEAVRQYLEEGHALDLGTYTVLEHEDEITQFLSELAQHKHSHFVCDIETNGLNAFDEAPRIKCISFSTEPRAATTIPTEGFNPEFMAFLMQELKKILEDPQIKKSGQSIAFERRWLKQVWGIDLKGIYWDTKIGAFELDKLHSTGLKNQAWKVGMGGYERMLPDKVEKCEGKVLFEYCAMDSDAEHRLIDLQQKAMPPKMRNYVHKIAIPLTYEFSDLHNRGLRVDMKKLNELEELGKEFLGILRSDLLDNRWVQKASKSSPYGEFNPNASRHMQYLIYGVLGEKVKFRTKEGAPAVDVKVMEGLKEKYPELITSIQDYRSIAKFHSTYIKGMRKNIKSDGRIHANFSQTTARSGRSATDHPNVQNWPHLPHKTKKFDKKYWPVFAPRTMIIPEDGCIFGEADYSQQELRVAAAISKDPVMTKVFEEGGDIHMETARGTFGESAEITEEKRRAAKTTNFGIIYGISPSELAWQIREDGGICDEETAARYIAGHRRKYTGYFKWVDELIKFLNEHGCVESPTGRRRNFPPLGELDQKDLEAVYREGVNTPIQGTAYDFLAMAIIRYAKARKHYKMRSFICNTIHDSNIFNIFPDEKDDLMEIYTELAENPPEWLGHWLGTIPLIVDWKFGDRWGELKEE